VTADTVDGAVTVDSPAVAMVAVESARRAARYPTLQSMIGAPGTSTVLLSGSRDPNAKMTLILLDTYGPAVVAKVPTTSASAAAVAHEAYALEALAAMSLGRLSMTLPRSVGRFSHGNGVALLSTALRGTPMAVNYHGWHHTARRRCVERDFAAAGDWLNDLQSHTAGVRAPVSLLTDVSAALRLRFPDHPSLRAATDAVEAAEAALTGSTTPRTVVHGDFWFGNLLLDGGRVSGVVDWESCVIGGEPLRDVARFVVSYALYLDRHTKAGGRVRGHRHLRAERWGAGVDHLLAADSWFSEVAQNFLTLQLGRLGVAPERWRDVVTGGIAEAAASADDPDFAAKHLEVLARAAGQADV
jgi:hypothetical protein